MPTPPWWTHAVVYQLYVRSFADADGDGIGDLDGIRSRLDHLQALGVDAVWLNPCYPSPQLDHGYDVSDYFAIEPDYGTLETFDALVAEAEQRGIRVLMDVVPNHCSSEHPWFTEAVAAGPGSAARERFWFRDGRGQDGDQPPNDWQAIFGGPAWTRITEPDGSPGQWYLGVFTPHQPDLCWDSPAVVAHFDDVLRFWFDRGVAGFRADAVTVLGKAPGLPDGGEFSFGRPSPWFNHQPTGHIAWRHWRQTVDAYNDANPGRDTFVVAEAYTPGQIELFAGYVNPGEFHQGFAFDLLLAPWRAGTFRRAIREMTDLLLPAGIAPAWTLNNHDNERTPTRYGRPSATSPVDMVRGSHLVDVPELPDLELGLCRANAAMLLVMGLPGSVYIYMGEEMGLPEVLDMPEGTRQDPLHHLTHGEQRGRDGCRIPLPWTADPAGSFGFSATPDAAAPWLPQPEGWGDHQKTAEATTQLYARAIELRRELLAPGAPFEVLELEDQPDLVVLRHGAVTVATNFADAPCRLPAAVHGGRTPVIATDDTAPDVLSPATTAWYVDGG